ncbi:MAG TPA: DUF4129 domain-containing protein [Candidatus Eisenbacteria bacterium]|nr:DUF4129 domain-containing protein [Candidatus Eisenbacteria bacterium]
MKPLNHRQRGKNGIGLIEEATHLLRLAPAGAWASYYLGSLPFLLGLLYFWADMSRSPFAYQHLVGEAFGMSLLFIWMKCWQTVFARRLRAHLAREPAPPRWTPRRWLRVLLVQSALQPAGLFLLPVALTLVLPFGWLFAFYQNVTALSDGTNSEIKPLLKKSWNQSLLWPMQNHIVLAILVLFGLFVLLNWLSVCFLLPQLLKILLGIETVFTQSPMSFLNSTFFTALLALTYLCLDPLIKAVYVLRCFYGESLQSGEDLKAEMKNFQSAPRMSASPPTKGLRYIDVLSRSQRLFPCRRLSVALILIIVGAASAAGAEAQQPATDTNNPSAFLPAISAPQLDRAIGEVLSQRKYTWRLPREKIVKPDTEKGAIARFMEQVANTLRDWARAVQHWIEKFLRWLLRREHSSASKSLFGLNWISSLQGLLFLLIAIVVSALAIFLYRVWRSRQRKAMMTVSEPMVLTPDVADENTGADQLPEDGWIKLGRELLERGDLRLAIRAFYLASLAHLAERRLITLARFKSNRDYENELRRRGHALPGLLPAFGENVSVFDRIWYGLHEANQELVNHFAANVERIKTV